MPESTPSIDIRSIAKSEQTVKPCVTETDNAEMFVAKYGVNLRYCVDRGKWLIYNGRRWEWDELKTVMEWAKESAKRLHIRAATIDDREGRREQTRFAERMLSTAGLTATLKNASSNPEVAIVFRQFDTDPWLFSVANGTVDLRTGELREHRREDLITKCAPFNYDPNATCPKWLDFLDFIMGGRSDMVEFLRHAIGYTLTGQTDEQCLFFLFGTGLNGKSVFCTILEKLLGDHAAKTRAESLMVNRVGGIPNDIAKLKGQRLVVASEISDGRRLDEGKVKDVTGGDKIEARFMRQEFFEFTPQFKLWLYGNHRPVIRGTDDGIWRRVRLIEFGVKIPPPKVDRHLTKELTEQLTGIFAWAVQGCLKWRENGLQAPEAVMAATDAYRADMDILGGFIDECCVTANSALTRVGDLYRKYDEWAQNSGERPLAKKKFSQSLEERGFERGPARNGYPTFCGIGIRTNEDQYNGLDQ